MIDEAREAIERVADGGFIRAAVSNPAKKTEPYGKIIAEPKLISGRRMIQLSFYTENKVKHENLEPEAAVRRLLGIFEAGYRQIDLYFSGGNVKIISGKRSVRVVRGKTVQKPAENPENTPLHNRKKNYIINELEPADWLVALGVTDGEGRVLADYRKKFKQFNRFLEMLRDIEGYIPENAEIIDFGCGKAYLTFAMYYYFNILNNKNVRIIGLDLKRDVVEECSALAVRLGYERLRFVCGSIEDYQAETPEITMVVSLHACDTATDYAMFNAIKWNARVIMAVPCCQHELNQQLKNVELEPVLKHGILRERFAAILTDAIRAEVLENCGYKTTVMEFIDTEHTPKNIIIRAVKRKNTVILPPPETLGELLRQFGVRQTLYTLCEKDLK